MSHNAAGLLRRFRVRELSKAFAITNREALASTSKVQLQNPFLPFLNPQTKKWAPPLYSRRRQAEIIKAAKAVGALHLLPPGPKLDTRNLQGFPRVGSSMPNEGIERALDMEKRVVPDVPEILQKEIEWMGDPKYKEVAGADIGARLYAGKKRMFKGHKWEREYKKRKAMIGVRMRDMPKRIERFKTVSNLLGFFEELILI